MLCRFSCLNRSMKLGPGNLILLSMAAIIRCLHFFLDVLRSRTFLLEPPNRTFLLCISKSSLRKQDYRPNCGVMLIALTRVFRSYFLNKTKKKWNLRRLVDLMNHDIFVLPQILVLKQLHEIGHRDQSSAFAILSCSTI